jgi:hypothetical protein
MIWRELAWKENFVLVIWGWAIGIMKNILFYCDFWTVVDRYDMHDIPKFNFSDFRKYTNLTSLPQIYSCMHVLEFTIITFLNLVP